MRPRDGRLAQPGERRPYKAEVGGSSPPAPTEGTAGERAGRRRAARRCVVGLALVAWVVATPGVARAHAAVVSSDPEPGAELAAAPGVVVLRFTEPLNVRLSRAVVLDPGGLRFEGSPTGEREIRVVLSTNAPGIYEVQWVTVSTLDGHALRGSFRFGVGVAPGEGAEGQLATAPGPADLVVAAFRGLESAALLLATGMLVLRRLARRAPGLGWVRPRLRPALAVAFVAGSSAVVGEGGLDRRPRRGGPCRGGAVGGAGRCAPPPRAGRRDPRPGHAPTTRGVAGPLGPGAPRAVLAGRDPRVPGHGGDRVLRGSQELQALRDVVATSYGQVLGMKVLGVLAMVPLSVLAWRRAIASPRLEAGVAVLVVGAAAVLAAYPLPPGRVAELEEAERAGAAASALPREGDLTLGGRAGQVLVGLTGRPGRPGPNQILVYLLPLEGEEAAAGIPATIRLGGRSIPTEVCGPTCRRAEIRLRGSEELAVRVGSEVGGIASFRLPDLPAPDGSSLLEHAQRRMHTLRTYRLEEVLASGLATVRASYAFEAPDRARISVRGGATRILVGGKEYFRPRPGARWRVELGPPLRVPVFVWDSFLPPVAPRIVGVAVVDGVRTRIVSFAGSGSLPIWFRLWIDGTGLVRRAEMRAQGHFMDHRYSGFDAPIEIGPPAGA